MGLFENGKLSKDKVEILRQQMKNERSSFETHWRDLGDHVLPTRPRFFVADTNRGTRKNLKIYDSTATNAARTLKSGMMAGITSPARPWFRLTLPDKDLAELAPVKEWLHDTTQAMLTVFLRSNLYNVLPIIYGDIGTFATGCLHVEEDFDDVMRFYPFPVGSYMIANDEKLRVNSFMREFRLTVRQTVEMFAEKDSQGNIDFSNISNYVQIEYKQGRFESWVDIRHAILPNDEFQEGSDNPLRKRFISAYYEASTTQGGKRFATVDNTKFLSIKGNDFFPVLAPRWEVTGEDVYGTACPGMESLGDIKQLQLGEKRIMQAIEKSIYPPMKGPTSLRRTKTSILPGDITFVDDEGLNRGFSPVHEIDPRINEMELKQQQVRDRINRSFFADLFLTLINNQRRDRTATEVDAIQEEKLLSLGPVLEQLNQDLLDPLIDIAFTIMERQGLIPEPPQEIEGADIKVEYISIMAQAQKAIGVSSIDRLTGFVTNLAGSTGDTSVLDKLDMDQVVDEMGESLGVSPELIRSDEDVDEIREGRAIAQQRQAQLENAEKLTKGVKDLAGAKLEEDSALKRLIDQANAGRIA